MNSAILFISNVNELELAKTRLNDKLVVDYCVNEIRRLDIDTIYLIGGKSLNVEDVTKRDNINEVIREISNKDGKCLLLSPFYPLLLKEDYEVLLKEDKASVLVDEEDILPIFCINNNELKDFESLEYKDIKVFNERGIKFKGYEDIYKFNEVIRKRINNKWLHRGVIIVDPNSTTIGMDVVIDKGTIINPGVVIEGRCLIGKNNLIDRNAYIQDTIMGDGNTIYESKLIKSTIHNNTKIGPCALVINNSEICDEASIGSYVKVSGSKIGKQTSVEHLSYIGDAIVGEDVNIGAGVVTVNQDGRSKNTSIIKNHSTIGSNVNLIAPITIGEYAMVAAGSTIDEDVNDGDMAIARLYQQNKKGYGYKFTKRGS